MSNQLVASATYGGDTGFVDVSSLIQLGTNSFSITVTNTTGGWTYGYQIMRNNVIVAQGQCGTVGVTGCDDNSRALGLVAVLNPIVVVGGGCATAGTTLCIDQKSGDARFQVQVQYSTSEGGGMSGPGNPIPLAGFGVTEGGLFWFFNAGNPEMLLKIIDACSLNQHFWVFFAATTNVGFTVTVTDSVTGHQAIYRNPDLTAALPVQDTGAMACP